MTWELRRHVSKTAEPTNPKKIICIYVYIYIYIYMFIFIYSFIYKQNADRREYSTSHSLLTWQLCWHVSKTEVYIVYNLVRPNWKSMQSRARTSGHPGNFANRRLASLISNGWGLQNMNLQHILVGPLLNSSSRLLNKPEGTPRQKVRSKPTDKTTQAKTAAAWWLRQWWKPTCSILPISSCAYRLLASVSLNCDVGASREKSRQQSLCHQIGGPWGSMHNSMIFAGFLFFFFFFCYVPRRRRCNCVPKVLCHLPISTLSFFWEIVAAWWHRTCIPKNLCHQRPQILCHQGLV